MRLAWRELQRRWRRYTLAVAALTVLAVLVSTLGGMLDDIDAATTGALRAQRAELVVYSASAHRSLLRSRLDPSTVTAISAVPGVTGVRGLGVALVGAAVPGRTEAVSVAVIGYQGGVKGVADPPPSGTAWVGTQLQGAGVEPDQRLRLGNDGPRIDVRGWAPARSLLLQPAIWVDPPTWRAALAASRPDAALPDDTFQIGLVTLADDADPQAVGDAIDEATGATDTVTKTAAIAELPGIKPMRATFAGLTAATLAVAAVVVALFFWLVGIEHIDLYRLLKALGATRRRLAGTLTLQALAVTVVALGIAVPATRLLAMVPTGIPFHVHATRDLATGAQLLVSAVAGSLLPLRHALRADAAHALRARR